MGVWVWVVLWFRRAVGLCARWATWRWRPPLSPRENCGRVNRLGICFGFEKSNGAVYLCCVYVSWTYELHTQHVVKNPFFLAVHWFTRSSSAASWAWQKKTDVKPIKHRRLIGLRYGVRHSTFGGKTGSTTICIPPPLPVLLSFILLVIWQNRFLPFLTLDWFPQSA